MTNLGGKHLFWEDLKVLEHFETKFGDECVLVGVLSLHILVQHRYGLTLIRLFFYF